MLLFNAHFEVIVTRSSYLQCALLAACGHLTAVAARLGERLAMFQGELQKQPGTNCCQIYKACCGLSLHNVLVIGSTDCWNPKCYRGLQFLYHWSGRNVGSVSPQRHVAFLKVACWLLLDLECMYSSVTIIKSFLFKMHRESKIKSFPYVPEGEVVGSKSLLCVCGCI